jgi:tetratricopeptide (TPR) repeat protein
MGLAALAGLVWGLWHGDGLVYLPAHEGRSWWVAPRSATAEMHFEGEVGRVFRAQVEWDEIRLPVEVRVAVLRSGEVRVNGARVEGLRLDGRHWKRPRSADLGPYLSRGTNEITICVTNPAGPAAVWAVLRAGRERQELRLAWEVVGADGRTVPARLAEARMESGPEGYLRPFVTLPEAAPSPGWLLGLLLVVVGGCVWVGRSVYQSDFLWLKPLRGPAGNVCLVAAVGVAWVLLFVHNLPQLPRVYGFDAEGHEAYIRLVQEERRLPLADEGWQMYQPPLYYLLGAVVLELAGLTVAEDLASVLLRALNGLVGFGHACLVFWVLRELFPEVGWPGRVGFLLASALPAHLVVTQYVTNEPLAAFWVSLGLALTLRARRCGDHPGWAAAGGAALGLAMLTKFSTLPAVALVLALWWSGLGRPAKEPAAAGGGAGRWAGCLGWALAVFLVVCGWHYGRVWLHFGRPLVGNWDLPGQTWWQDPGYRVAAHYARFGEALVRPWFSGLESFWDGLYATLWGDGLASSASWLVFRPPWNESWAAVAWWLGLVWTLVILVGMVSGFGSVVRGRPGWEWFGPSLVGVYLWALLYMSARVPSYAQVKAFYALPALSGLAVLVVQGWRWLAGSSGVRHGLLTGLLVTWWVVSFGSFWIPVQHPQTVLVQALWALDRGDGERALTLFQEAMVRDPVRPELRLALARAVQARPGDVALQGLYGTVLEAHGLWAEALAVRKTAVDRAPDRAEAWNNLAWTLVTVPEPALRDPAAAVRYARQACELSGWREPTCVGTLAAALAAAGEFEEATTRAEQAIALARQQGRLDLVEGNERYREAYRAGRLPAFRQEFGR